MTAPHRSSRRSLTQRIALPLLAALVLLAQSLGFAHRVLHLPGSAMAASAHAATASDGRGDVFGDHADDSRCRLYDQLACADIVTTAAAAFAEIVQPIDSAGALPAGRLAPQASGFLARGPPLTA